MLVDGEQREQHAYCLLRTQILQDDQICNPQKQGKDRY